MGPQLAAGPSLFTPVDGVPAFVIPVPCRLQPFGRHITEVSCTTSQQTAAHLTSSAPMSPGLSPHRSDHLGVGFSPFLRQGVSQCSPGLPATCGNTPASDSHELSYPQSSLTMPLMLALVRLSPPSFPHAIRCFILA